MKVDDDPVHVLVWSEATAPEDVYPNDLNATIAEGLNDSDEVVARAVDIDDPDQGASEDRLAWADAICWWGHLRHDEVEDATVDRVEHAVREEGVGFVGLHSGHYARPFTRLLGTSGDLGDVRVSEGEEERVTVEAPDHPITEGVEDFSLPHVEMFGEPFDVPDPETVVLHSTFSEGGEFRSGVTFRFGEGRGFYLRPGHEEFRTYHHPSIRRVLANAVRWVASR